MSIRDYIALRGKVKGVDYVFVVWFRHLLKRTAELQPSVSATLRHTMYKLTRFSPSFLNENTSRIMRTQVDKSEHIL